MQRKTLGMTLLVCSILAGGLIAAGFVSTNGIADDGTGLTLGDSSLTKTLNVTVYANVQGKLIPIEGANVTVYKVTVEENDTAMTITLEKIAVAVTGDGGVVQITLPEGNYTMVADYYGLRSVGILSTDTDENVTMVLNAQGICDPGHFQRDLGYCDPNLANRPRGPEVDHNNMTSEMVMPHCH